jgi:hydrogenase maturation protease
MSVADRSLLVLGWGNLSRGDDALGPLFVAGLRRHAQAATRPDVEFIEEYQLQVEHVIDLARRSRVLFVDASCACKAPFEVSRPRPTRDASFSSHAMSPAALLHAYSDLYLEPPPPCTLLAIRGRQFELGAPPGRSALKHLEQALEWGRGWLATPDDDGDFNLRAFGHA